MTLLALWYRKGDDDLYAIADSRLTTDHGVLTDQAPKFSSLRITCYAKTKEGKYNRKVIDNQIAVGYAGSSMVAYTTITVLQAYLSSLTVNVGFSTPTMKEVADFTKSILEANYLRFGELWGDGAKCTLVLFGYLPADRKYQAFAIGVEKSESKRKFTSYQLDLIDQSVIASVGSCSGYFIQKLKTAQNDKERESRGYGLPFEILEDVIASGERGDVGGNIQIAIVSRDGVLFPHIMKERLDRGECAADLYFLGYDTSKIGKVGECGVGRHAIGPDPDTLLRNRKDAGYI